MPTLTGRGVLSETPSFLPSQAEAEGERGPFLPFEGAPRASSHKQQRHTPYAAVKRRHALSAALAVAAAAASLVILCFRGAHRRLGGSLVLRALAWGTPPLLGQMEETDYSFFDECRTPRQDWPPQQGEADGFPSEQETLQHLAAALAEEDMRYAAAHTGSAPVPQSGGPPDGWIENIVLGLNWLKGDPVERQQQEELLAGEAPEETGERGASSPALTSAVSQELQDSHVSSADSPQTVPLSLAAVGPPMGGSWDNGLEEALAEWRARFAQVETAVSEETAVSPDQEVAGGEQQLQKATPQQQDGRTDAPAAEPQEQSQQQEQPDAAEPQEQSQQQEHPDAAPAAPVSSTSVAREAEQGPPSKVFLLTILEVLTAAPEAAVPDESASAAAVSKRPLSEEAEDDEDLSNLPAWKISKGPPVRIAQASLHHLAEAHPLYRIPPLADDVVLLKSLSPKAALEASCCKSVWEQLKAITLVMSKPRISTEDTGQLIAACEGILGILEKRHRTAVRGLYPSRAVERLGIRYLCFDALLSVTMLLGSAMHADQWFPRLIKSVPTDFAPDADRKCRKLNYYFNLAVELNNALATIKQGKRPSELDTVLLKRKLFNTHVAANVFNLRDLDPWAQLAAVPLAVGRSSCVSGRHHQQVKGGKTERVGRTEGRDSEKCAPLLFRMRRGDPPCAREKESHLSELSANPSSDLPSVER
ncbi:hypothetical protein Efla_007474 [Eimeria flavescens]